MTDMTQIGDVFAAESDNNMRDILKHLSSEYVLDCMDSEIDMFFSHPFNSSHHPANIVKAFEAEYTECLNMYPNSADTINGKRIETYYYILDHIGKAFGLNINKSANPDDNMRLAYALYDILITNINANMLTFLGNYILNNTDDLYDACELKAQSKTLDNSVIALYSDPKTPVVIAFLYKVIKFMSEFDITISDFIYAIPNIDAQTKSFILANIEDAGDFYKKVICGRFFNCYYAATLVTELKAYISSVRQVKNFDIADYINK